MRLLLDTHVFLWYITGDPRLTRNFGHAIEECESVYLSVASLWETIVKYRLGKLPLPEPPDPWLIVQRERHEIESLPLSEGAVARLSGLADHHRDPFDRILVCQALEHDLEIVTVDPLIGRYPAKLWVAR